MAYSGKKVPTQQELNKLWKMYESGDKTALKNLQSISRTLAKRANQRIRDMRKRGLGNTAAITRAEYWISNELGKRKGFIESANIKPDLMSEQLDVVTSFLNWQTSSAKGELKRRENIIKGLNESDKVSIQVDARILDFLDSDAWSALKNIGSDQAIKAFYEMLHKGKTLEELLDIYNKYLHDESMDLFDVLDEWKKMPEKDNSDEENSGGNNKRNRRKKRV